MSEYLRPGQLDDVARAVLTLAEKVWVLHDRQRMLESILESRGIEIAAELETRQPTEAERAALDDERRAFVQALVDTLVPPKATQ